MGIDTPTKARNIAPRSMIVLRLSAEITPTLTPTTSQMIEAPIARLIVAGALLIRASLTSSLEWYEYPRSPTAAFLM